MCYDAEYAQCYAMAPSINPMHEKLFIGWKEWCSLPQLGLPYLKAKVDTGAATSALHAIHIQPFQDKGEWFMRFETHPLQKNSQLIRTCTAKLIDHRLVASSNGEKQNRYVIQTPLTLGGYTWDIELTLTNRIDLGYRMLLGRQALQGFALIDLSRAFCLGKITRKFALNTYQSNTLQAP